MGSPHITHAEGKEIRRRLSEGATQKEIADALGRSEQGVGRWIRANVKRLRAPKPNGNGHAVGAYRVTVDGPGVSFSGHVSAADAKALASLLFDAGSGRNGSQP